MKLNYRNLLRSSRHVILNLLLVILVLYVPVNIAEGNVTTFLCSSVTFNEPALKPYINCTVSIEYRGNFKVGCETSKENSAVILPQKHLHSYSLDCVSDVPMNVSFEVSSNLNGALDVFRFPTIRQRRIVDQYEDKTSYKFELHVPLLKFHSVVRKMYRGVLKYQISTTYPVSIKTNVILVYDPSAYYSRGACQRNLFGSRTVGLTTTLLEEILEIPVFIANYTTSYLYLEICKYKVPNTTGNVQTDCSSEEDPPTICSQIQESISILKEKYKENPQISLATILDTFKIKDDAVQFFEHMDPKGIKQLETPNQNLAKRPLVLYNHNYTEDEFKYYLGLLKKISNISCAQPHSFTFDKIIYILQLLGAKEVVIGRDEDLSFNPVGGFKIGREILLKYGPGKYYFGPQNCFKYNYFVIDFSSLPISRYLQLWPPKYDMLAGELKMDDLRLSCTSKNITTEVKEEYYEYPNPHPLMRDATAAVHHYNLSGLNHDYKSAAVILYSPQETVEKTTISSKLSCGSKKNDEWTIFLKYYTPPFMYFPKPDVFACFAAYPVEMKNWVCKNRFQCQMTASLCTPDVTAEKELHEEKKEHCTLEEEYKGCCVKSLALVNTIPCADFSEDNWDEKKYVEANLGCQISKPAMMGVVRCLPIPLIYSFADQKYIYFRGFDNVLYLEYKMKGPPPKNATLKLTSLGHWTVFYTKEEYTFQCEAHCLFYDDGIQWFLKFANGTILQPSLEGIKHFQDSKGEVFNSKTELKQNLDKSLKEVICSAPRVNSHDWTNVSLPITVLESTLPKITSSDTDVRFTEGSKDQALTCTAEGLPLPKIEWKRPNSEIEEPVLILDNTLLFPIYNSKFSGEYVCTASNLAGSSSRSFFIQEKKDHTTTYTIIGIILTIAVFSAVLVLLYLTNERIKKFREMREIIKLLNGSKSPTGKENGTGTGETEATAAHLLFDTNYEIKMNSFIIDRSFLLGKGEFGEVYKGLLEGINKTVAFKTVRSNSGTSGTGPLRALVSEAKILMYIGPHENLVTLMGVYRQEINSGILYVAIEFCEMGSLKSFLSENGRLFTESSNSEEEGGDTEISGYEDPFSSQNSLCTTKSLLMWSAQIANAMEYLGTKNVVHSDLATRNVLLTSEGTAKVTDFGLSRRMYNYSEYVKKGKDPLPWKWLAIESLRSDTFSAKSDVWAFGITLWEIFSLGDTPYPGMEYNMEFVQKLENGLKNFKPKWASDEIYDVMELCWHLNPESRPQFASMKMIFEYTASNGMSGLKNKVSQEGNLDDIAVQLASSVYLQLEI